MLNVRRVYMWCLLCPAVGVNHKLCTVYLYLGVILYDYFWVLLCWITRIIYLSPTQNRIGTSTNLVLLYCTGGHNFTLSSCQSTGKDPVPFGKLTHMAGKKSPYNMYRWCFFCFPFGQFRHHFPSHQRRNFRTNGTSLFRCNTSKTGCLGICFFFSLLKVKVCLPGLNPKRKCWGDGWPFFPKLGGYLAMLQHGGGNRHTKCLETKKVNKNSKICFLNSTWNSHLTCVLSINLKTHASYTSSPPISFYNILHYISSIS